MSVFQGENLYVGAKLETFPALHYNERVTCYCGNFRVFANKNIHRIKKGAFYRKAALQPVERKSYRKQGDNSLYGLRGIRPGSGT